MFNMRNLKQGLIDHTELTKRGRRLLRSGSFFYFILLCLMCFLPQQPEPGMETPGIQHFGRIVVLLVPLNSVMNLGQITSVLQLIKVILQNIANIFLLSPLVFSTPLAMALVEESKTGLVLRLCDELVD